VSVTDATTTILAQSNQGDIALPSCTSRASVRLALLGRNVLPKAAITLMQGEAERIWARHAVRVDWLSPDESLEPTADIIRVVSTASRSCSASDENDGRTLGCFKAGRGPERSLILVFPDRARLMIVRWAARFDQRVPAGWIESRTAALLGRVLAHEIGHYLLGPEHSMTGLMRGQYDWDDLLGRGPNGISLTELQKAELAENNACPQLASR